MSHVISRYPAILFPVVLFLAPSIFAQVPGSLQVTDVRKAADGVTLHWQKGSSNSAYTVQFREQLEDSIWRLPWSTQPFPLSTSSWTDLAAGEPERFYRVMAVPAAQRGMVLSVTNVQTLSTFTLQFLLNLAGAPITAQYNVQCYRVVYETIDPWGARTRASGALLLPVGVGKLLPLVSYQHGTIALTNDAPSSMDLQGEITVGLAFASTGYAAAVPDYLGLGASPGLHPYHHARSEATAGVDLLRAAKSLCTTNGFPLNDKLFLCGYSQGGHATMALLRELEAYHTNEFSVTACAPMAGAYDLSGVTTTNFLSGKTQPNPYYFLYLLAAYQSVYHFAPNLADLLREPYNTTLPPLLNGTVSSDSLNAAIPGDPTQILKPEYLADFRTNLRHPLRLALEENNLYDWQPRAPLRLFHCAADQDVIFANSTVALTSFHAHGASQVDLVDPKPTANHTGCSVPSLALAKTWFDSLR